MAEVFGRRFEPLTVPEMEVARIEGDDFAVPTTLYALQELRDKASHVRSRGR
jgi:hypothetical protein